MFDRILVPVDGSRFAEFALSPGLQVARRANASLEIATVLDRLPLLATYVDVERALSEGAEDYLGEWRERIRADWDDGRVEISILRGPVAEAIESRARENEVDLVVMASHGRGPLSRFWLGSVTDQLIRHSPCPVLVIRPRAGETPEVGEAFRPERILVPVDRTEVSTAVLERTVDLARLFDSRFRLVHAVSYPSEEIHPYLTQASRLDDQWLKDALEEGERRLETVAGRLRKRGAEVSTSVVRAESPATAILAEARAWDADVVAMATHGREGIPRAFLGSVADKVVRGAHLPVLLHRPTTA